MRKIEVTCHGCGLSIDVRSESMTSIAMVLNGDEAHDLLRPDCPVTRDRHQAKEAANA